jgi:hypothetical protein
LSGRDCGGEKKGFEKERGCFGLKLPDAKKVSVGLGVKKLERNYKLMAEAFRREEGVSKKEWRKFGRWMKLHNGFFSGAYKTISKEEKRFLDEAVVVFNRVRCFVEDRGGGGFEDVAVDCDDLRVLLKRSR